VTAPNHVSLTDDEVLEILARGELEPLGLLPRSSNYTFLARVRDGSDELLAVYKPRAGEAPLWDFPSGTLYLREVAAYIVATTLGWPRVPPTLERDGPHGVGSVQRFLPFDPERHYFTMEADAELTPTFRRVALFDAVVNNADRKSGHCLLADDGELFFIDHGVCFSEEPKLRTVIWGFAGETISPADADDLRRLRETLDGGGEAATRLMALLSPDEVRATMERIDALLATGRYPQPGPGRPYPWPPV
jgi:uncharacterized repeat protein (TIGR03843 family)